MSSKQSAKSASITVENIGGIDETEVTFSPGVTVLKGENATNRTSLLQAIMAALGSDNVSIKGDADEARVELESGGSTYTRELARQGSSIRTDGDPYLDDPTLAELFAFLLESNEARRAVVGQTDLRELIMRPIDTDEIQREIERLVDERRDLDEELEELDSLKDRLPTLEERRTKIRNDIEETKEELAAKEAEIAERDADIEESREEQAELDERLEELRSRRSELEDVRYDIETERESLEVLRTEKREAQAELEEVPDAPIGEVGELETDLENLRERKRRLEADVKEIQSVVAFNQELLEDADNDVLDALAEQSEVVTDDLLPDETITCWTCGSEVPEDEIESTVDRLKELSRSKRSDLNDVESQIEALTSEIREYQDLQQQRERLESRIDDATEDIEAGEDAVERLSERREELQTEIQELEDEIAEMEDDAYDAVLDLHKEANQLEYELGRLESDLDDVENEISEIESRLDEEAEIESRREDLDTEVEKLRTKIDRIETQAIEEFNDRMETVLEILEYDNLERIWLERVEKDVREGRRSVTKTAFELHVIRATDSGVTYEDTVEHLSESEREVTGLVFALAGYFAHEVYDEVPFLLMDSLEAIDADRIGRLVEYVGGYSEYLVVALLPEDADALDGNAEIVTGI